MTDDELIDWNRKGYIPGPKEGEVEFRRRLRQVAPSEWAVPSGQWEWVRHHLRELFDFEPHCLEAFYSNRGLALWEGAACWIEKGKVRLQLREGFRKGSYLGLYSREEVLAHEAVHAARSAFDEPENEEFFAYAAAEKRWRRVLGPIVRRPWETWVALGGVAGGMVWSWLGWCGIGWIGWGLGRLAMQHRRLRRAMKTLMREGKGERWARSVLLRLTDGEIRELARGEGMKGDESLRWRMIRLVYFGKE